MRNINRRQFIRKSALAAGGTVLPAVVPSTVFGAGAPSNKIVMGCIGTGGQGRYDMSAFLNESDARVVAICDVDAGHRKMAEKMVAKKYGKSDCKLFNDFRDLLAIKDIDAVTVCTPDHWHGLITIAAARAGKDIYCEKPLTNTIAEGIAVYRTVKRFGRVLQTGSHERSRLKARYACQVVQNKRIGKLRKMVVNLPCTEGHLVSAFHDKDKHPVMPVPEGFDYNFWLGCTPLAPYTEKRCHFWWRFILNYGGGEMTDRGAHVIDLAQLGNGTDDTGPVELQAQGERAHSTLFNTFFNFSFNCKYANGVEMVGTSNEPRGVKFIGDDGWIFIHVHGGHLEASSPELLNQKFGPNDIHLGISPGHHRNFLDCVKSRQDPMAPVGVGFHTAVICHLLNISMLLGGRKLKWDPDKNQIIGDPEANSMLSRPMRAPWHL